MRRDCIRCGQYEQAPELDKGLCWMCATSEDAPVDPFTEGETQDLLAKFFDTDKPVLHADDPDLDRISPPRGTCCGPRISTRSPSSASARSPRGSRPTTTAPR
jgi:hypothetical protein